MHYNQEKELDRWEKIQGNMMMVDIIFYLSLAIGIAVWLLYSLYLFGLITNYEDGRKDALPALYTLTPFAVLSLVFVIGLYLLKVKLDPGPLPPTLDELRQKRINEGKAKKARLQKEAQKTEWLAEIKFQPKLDGLDACQQSRLQIAKYFLANGLVLQYDPFYYNEYDLSDCQTMTSVMLRDYQLNVSFHQASKLIFLIKATDYAEALCLAESIAADLLVGLDLLSLVNFKVFKFSRLDQDDGSSDGSSLSDSTLDLVVDVALFTGSAFVIYKAAKGLAHGVTSIADATFGRAGKLVDVVTNRIEKK